MNYSEFKLLLNEHYHADELSAIFRLINSYNFPIDDKTIHRLIEGEPIQYIIGKAYFYQRDFIVSRDTLIPRPETEELCEIILKDMPDGPQRGIDIGTGSGCIAITLALENPNLDMTATDISIQALAFAERNIANFQLNSRVQTLHHDFINDELPGTNFQFIVSNPPYISEQESDSMSKGVLDWEPHSALFPRSKDVLIFYRRLAYFLSMQQCNTCYLWAEINPMFHKEVLQIFSAFSSARIIADMSGKPRFISIKKEGLSAPSFTK